MQMEALTDTQLEEALLKRSALGEKTWRKFMSNEEEVINLADKMREEEEGFGLSDALVRIVSMAYQKGVHTLWMDLYGDMFDEEEDQNA